jgi:hypothetical protein
VNPLAANRDDLQKGSGTGYIPDQLHRLVLSAIITR